MCRLFLDKSGPTGQRFCSVNLFERRATQCPSAEGAAGGTTLRISGTIAVAMMKQTMITRKASA
jgi:hypothetical protein